MLLLLEILFLGGLVVSEATDVIYTIVPSSQNNSDSIKSCPQNKMRPESFCLTLQQFADSLSTSSYNSTNLTLVFVEGEHELSDAITISDISVFSMVSRDDTYDSTSIECGGIFVNFNFSSVHSVHMSGLTFSGCETTTESVQHLIVENCTFLGTEYSGTALTISESNADITDTEFLLNTQGTFRDGIQFLSIHLGSTVGGAVIITHSNVTIDECLFEDNEASRGGAVYVKQASDVVVKNSDFHSNAALDCDTGLCYGGALYLEESSSMSVHDCTFGNNTSEGNGGVAAVINATLTISHSYASDNSASSFGGVISTEKGGTVTIVDSNFTQNNANGGGVISALEESTVIINRSRFSYNSARNSGGGVMIAVKQCDVTMQNSTFDSNMAHGYGRPGGVAYFSGIDISTVILCDFIENSADNGGVFGLFQSSVTISDSDFSLNIAEINAGVLGGISGSNATFNNCSFDRNEALYEGGVVSMKEGSLNISSCISNNNVAKYGGVMSVVDIAIVIDNSTFTDNVASIDGGALALYTQCQVEIYDSRFENNFAYHDGGVAYFFNGSTSTIDGCHFKQNSAGYGGALVAKRGSNVDINSCTFIENSAITNAAVMYGSSLSVFSVYDSVFMDNKAGDNGGLCYIIENTRLNLTLCDLERNSAGHNGGALFGYNHSVLAIDSCTVYGNSAGGSGGAVYGRAYTEITINNSTIEVCSAQNAGGGISALTYSYMEVVNSQFMHNTADYGGFIQVYLGSTADVDNSTFIENWSNLDGGVMAIYKNSTIRVESSSFRHNNASFGGVFAVYRSTVELVNATFFNNSGEFAGVIRLHQGSTIIATSSNFLQNKADQGGVLYGEGGDIVATSCYFNFNTARLLAAVLFMNKYGNVYFDDNSFVGNSAGLSGGVMTLFDKSAATLENCMFRDNRVASFGGAIRTELSALTISKCVFNSTYSGNLGGVVGASTMSNITIYGSRFMNNLARYSGGVIDISVNSTAMVWDSNFTNNSATMGYGGVMSVYEKTVAKLDNCVFDKNMAFNDGGAVSVYKQSRVTITACIFTENQANYFGGAIAVEMSSSVVINNSLNNEALPWNQTVEDSDSSGTHIHNNTANVSGGGISIYNNSSLYFKDLTSIRDNEAYNSGGAIDATDSHLIVGSSVRIVGNRAYNGGGISLANSDIKDSTNESDTFADISFVSNEAMKYGGALYVNDFSNSNACLSEPTTRCFFGKAGTEFRVNFEENHANGRGDDLFGGLLDRCLIDTTVVDDSGLGLGTGTDLFMQISNFGNLTSISSEAVNLCFCDENGDPDCTRNTDSISVLRGNPFSFPVAAVDQVRRPVSATIMSAIQGLTLAENQTMRRIGGECSDLNYQVNFPAEHQHDFNLTIYADGPCSDQGISKLSVLITIKSCVCGPGFMPENNTIRCACTCDTRDSTFTSYITECDASTQSVIREGLFWIKYIENNDSSDNSGHYFIVPHCPLDYCQPPNIPIYINLLEGPNAQCAEYRQGLLCGSCQQGYSLSLGSSKCLKCPKNWYSLFVGITIAAILAGLLLVVVFLALNLTVGVGSFNSIVFFANIVYANQSIYFRQPNLTFLLVFISWLNLDIGIDTCFFEGMDTYAKTWIQLAFPAYIIFLVVMVICISRHSKRFANLIATRNPVATLATLIVISYTRFLQTIITAFSFVTLTYPNGTHKAYWLPDATFEFDGAKQKLKIIVLLVLTIIILIVFVLFTLILFFWQWLLRLSEYKLFKWTQNQKLHGFIDTYHGPYMAKHRYWIGMLLLVRVLIYLIAAFSASSEQPITLLCTVITICCLLLFKAVLRSRVYRNKFVNVIESAIFFNIVIFALITLYTFNIQGYKKRSDLLRFQVATAYLSVGAVLILLLVMVSIHAYRYGSKRIYSCFGRQDPSKLVHMMYNQEEVRGVSSTSLESSLNEFLDVVDAPRARYTVPFQRQANTMPTTSVLSVPQRKKSSKRRKSSSVATAKGLNERANSENNIALIETQLSA